MSDPVRHFAVQAAVIGIRSRWNEMSAGDHEQLKLAAIEALQTVCAVIAILLRHSRRTNEQGTKPGGAEPTHFKEKLVQVPVEIAKRDWPQRWPGFIDGLLGLLSSDVRCLGRHDLASPAHARVGSCRMPSWRCTACAH